mgnify:CR=1 FL=1
MKIYYIVLAPFLIFNCATEVNKLNDINEGIERASLSEEDNMECNMYNSFAYENFENKNFRSTVDNYKYMIELGCSERYAEYIFEKMGRSYVELGKRDSASIIFKQGMKYLKNNKSLLVVAAWNAGKMNNVNEQITYLDMLLSFDDGNSKIYEDLSDVYRDNEMYNEQIAIINQWLRVDPTSKKANSEKKAAFKALGKDELDVDKERWMAEPSNISYGIDYAIGLKNKGSDSEVVEVCNSLLIYDKYNIEVLELKAESHLNLYEDELALEVYLDMDKINPNNYKIEIELSKIYINKEDYETAYKWANNSVRSSGNKGDALYQRAEVFYSVAESCTGDALSFWDKVVFEIAWEDYDSAVNSGFNRARTRADFLYENNITKTSDWFMRPDGEMKTKPEGACYSWINRSIKRK